MPDELAAASQNMNGRQAISARITGAASFFRVSGIARYNGIFLRDLFLNISANKYPASGGKAKGPLLRTPRPKAMLAPERFNSPR